jgi:glycosyltransferase involved in cell wall biosynthesis
MPGRAPSTSRRAVIYSPDTSAVTGGVERFCALLRATLERLGWSVALAGPTGDPPRWVYRLGGGFLWWDHETARAGAASDPDLIVSNGFLGGLAPRGVPRVHVIHGNSVAHTRLGAIGVPARERVRRIVGGGLAEALAARRAASVVAVAQSAADEWRRYYRAHVDRVIENGVDIDLFSPGPRDVARDRLGLAADGRYALYVGRVEPQKGAELLEPACRRAGFELLVAGPARSPIGRSLGSLSPELCAIAYRAADCVLFPTRYEAGSYVVLEALACGVPLLTTRVGWMRTFLERVPEYEALVIRPEVEDMADRLRSLADLDTPALTGPAQESVRERNSLTRFDRDWTALFAAIG